MKASFKDYYQLAKPGIVYGNIITTVAAFLFATRWHFFGAETLWLFLATIIGVSLVIASGCVLNNYLDKEIDAKMERTRMRALVVGRISDVNAIIYAVVLGVLGIAVLEIFVNMLTAGIALIGIVMYIIIYGAAKRGSSWGAVVGSFAGAVPIVIGYTAVTNQFDIVAILLFLILVAWQMPHFYAIAIYRLDEYMTAGIPVLPAVKGIRRTKVSIISYIVAYILAVSLLFIIGATGYTYLFLVLLVGITWFLLALHGFRLKTYFEEAKWARQVFLASLIVLITFSMTLALAPLFP